MLRQDELVFVKPISKFHVSPVVLVELRLAMVRRKKKSSVPAGRCSTTSRSGTRASEQFAGKQKVIEIASSSDSMVPANRRAALVAGSLPLPATS